MFEATVLSVESELTQFEFNYLFSLISSEKRKRIQKFHFKKDAQNCLLADILARIEICRATGISNKELKFSINEYGKPFLTTNPHVHFNISHAGHYIACAVSDAPVGIDIELIKPIEMKIAERFFTPDETAYIIQDESMRRFYEVWTKKESRIKWEGLGLHKPLTSFSVFDLREQEAIFYHEVFSNNEVISHLCSSKKQPPAVIILNTSILMNIL